MHATAWRTLRSASVIISPARIIGGRRLALPRYRAFHRSARVSRPSSSPSDPRNPGLEPKPDNKAERESEKAPLENGSNVIPQGAIGNVDEEFPTLEQKYWKAREDTRMYGSALKRSMRNRRPEELPPIIVPNWFLKRNVRLKEERARKADLEGKVGVKIKIVGNDGEKPLTSISGLVPRQSLLEMCAAMHNAEGKGSVADVGPAWIELANGIGVGKEESDPRSRSEKQEPTLNPLVLEEVAATISACLATARPELGVSFAAAKTNLILHSPLDGYIEQLDKIVEDIGAQVGADVIKLDAQDLAQLAGDYIGENPDDYFLGSLRTLGYHTHRIRSERVEEDEEDHEGDEDTDGGRFESFAGPSKAHSLGASSSPVVGGIAVVSGSLKDLMKSIGPKSRMGFPMPPDSVLNFGKSLSPVELSPWDNNKLSALLEALVGSNQLKRDKGICAPSAPGSSASHNEPERPDPVKHWIGETRKVLIGEPISHGRLIDHIKMMGLRAELDTANLLLEAEATIGTAGVMMEGDATSFIERNLFEDLTSAGLKATFKRVTDKEVKKRVSPISATRKTIVLLRDFKELNATKHGGLIVTKLMDLVSKRRREGQQIMIVGTTSSADLVPELSKEGIQSLQTEPFESLTMAIVTPFSEEGIASTIDFDRADLLDTFVESPQRWKRADLKRNLDINLRHIQDMLRRLDPMANHITNPENPLQLPRLRLSERVLKRRVLQFDEIHRISLAAIGIQLSLTNSKQLEPIHIAMAISLLDWSDEFKTAWGSAIEAERGINAAPPTQEAAPAREELGNKFEKLKATANKHEKRLFGGIVYPNKLKTTFQDVHAPEETIEALKTLTSLSLSRPDAFSYGVLASDKIPGLLLYGPPGTGKTLLAKAVAKTSGATMLEVSGSEIYDMYVGEGEKNVRAIFSLARKLSPCVVFIDEADAIFGSRSGPRNRTSHREIINQFLKEWDGMNDLSVFIMVATNRPFDLDDAVLRRLPRRLLVDLPREEDREEILKIHLKDEKLDDDVNLAELARQTPLYSGSDLKNLAVAAALACVREENELRTVSVEAAEKRLLEAASPKSQPSPASPMDISTTSSATGARIDDGTGDAEADLSEDPVSPESCDVYRFPSRRTLTKQHFDKAMQEISASISEDMSSLVAIRKFDEQFGERKGRRKRSVWGFGTMGALDEGEEERARVRRG